MMNRQVRLKSRPNGIPQAENFELAEALVPEIKDGQVLVKNEFLSVEPAMRGWVSTVANYSTPVGIGEVMRSFTAGTIVKSRRPGFAEGDKVMGMLGWQDFAAGDATNITRKVRETDLPLSLSLGVLGLNGVTAYFGLLDLGTPRPGDTVVVSTAAGSVGSAVGQIAKLMGCRTVGITGGAEKVKMCRETFGYDAAIDYKAGNVADALKAACPRGVDVYFDNTSGAISDAVMAQLAQGARVVICGTAAISSWDPPPMGPRVERHILVKRARVSGLLIFDYAHRYEEAVARLADWVRAGKLKYREDIVDGIEHAPGAIAELYRGENLGKRLIRL
ncbi:MAG: NADP-dependent oxidoreductase [Pseudolabrys sp.]|nr:NADP-dependent oxidoreductase [Pseudolabrys sp.]MBV9955457.1 NADP-dependent oxidoreductase [Pseudolabrys sp.]